MEDPVDLEIGRGHRRTVLLDLNLESLPGKVHRPFAGFPDRAAHLSKFSFHRVRVAGLPVSEKYNLVAPSRFPLTP